MCIAVSTSGDPGGSYNRYDYNFGNLPDYPKFGVWPDGYYMTVNQFDLRVGFNYAGIATWAFDRDAMLAGDPAAAIGFDDLGLTMFSILPADLDGASGSSGWRSERAGDTRPSRLRREPEPGPAFLPVPRGLRYAGQHHAGRAV